MGNKIKPGISHKELDIGLWMYEKVGFRALCHV